MVNGLSMKRISLILGALLLLMGLSACTDCKVNTDYLQENWWRQVEPAGTYEYGIDWSFSENYLSIHYNGSCLGEMYAYSMKGNRLEIAMSDDGSWPKPFILKIQKCTENHLTVKVLSIPDGFERPWIDPDVSTVELEKI